MAFFIIPVPTEVIPFHEQVELNGSLYLLKFQYQFRSGFWLLTITKAGVVLLASVKLVNTLDLLAQYRHIEDLPQGKIIISDQNLQQADPDATNFGDNVLLMYEDVA